jgi:hypothetical protein
VDPPSAGDLRRWGVLLTQGGPISLGPHRNIPMNIPTAIAKDRFVAMVRREVANHAFGIGGQLSRPRMAIRRRKRYQAAAPEIAREIAGVVSP